MVLAAQVNKAMVVVHRIYAPIMSKFPDLNGLIKMSCLPKQCFILHVK